MGVVRIIILILISSSTFAQLPTAKDSLVVFTQGGRNWGWFEPTGWSPTDTNCVLLVSFYGNGQTVGTVAKFIETPPGRQINDAGTNWNGQVTIWGSVVKKVAVLMIPNYGDGAVAAYASVIEYVIQQKAMDTSSHKQYIITGISGGGGRMEDYITNTGHSSPYSNVFERICFASSVSTRSFTTFKPYKCWIWVAGSEHDQTTSFVNNINTYNSWKGYKRLVQYSITQAQGAHSTNTWDQIFNLTSTISTASNSMIKFFLSDGTDGITPIKVDGFKKINQ